MDFNPPSAKDLISPGSLKTKTSSVPVMPYAFQSTGPSEIPEPAGVMGYPSSTPSKFLDFLQLFHLLPEALMANRVTPSIQIQSS